MEDYEEHLKKAHEAFDALKAEIANQRLMLKAFMKDTIRSNKKLLRDLKKPMIESCYYGLSFNAAYVKPLSDN